MCDAQPTVKNEDAPPQRDSRFLDRRFFAGCAVGLLLPTSAFIAFFWWAQSMSAEVLANLRRPPIPSVKPVSYDWQLTGLAGTPVDTRRLRGKVLIVNVWATWCAPCVAELPSIAGLQHSLAAASNDVEVLCISAESINKLRAFAQRPGAPDVPIYSAAVLPGEFATSSIPATFLVGKDGRIRLQHTGAADWSTDECVQFVDELLREQG